MNKLYTYFIITVDERNPEGGMKCLSSTREWEITKAREALATVERMQERFPEAEGHHVVVDGYYVKHVYVLYDVVEESKLRSMSQNGENRCPCFKMKGFTMFGRKKKCCYCGDKKSDLYVGFVKDRRGNIEKIICCKTCAVFRGIRIYQDDKSR